MIHYFLGHDIKLASSRQKQGSGGCASLLFSSWCGSSSSGIRKDGTPSLKVDAVHPSSNGDKDGSPMEPPATPFPVPLAGNRENDAGVVLKVCMKSSLKKPCGCAAGMENTAPNAHGIDCKRRRKVQWIDANGQDLAQIKEFEQSRPLCRPSPSPNLVKKFAVPETCPAVPCRPRLGNSGDSSGSDDEEDEGGNHGCSCVIQ
ncbi:uncharacterized protein LOC131075671 [Cryptomeria japonica]|uniref:uncharacterized protein LOC131075671 n=1 Tax=Cryptomeria japonica TaxID=3369 RepID=UPI0027DA4ED5|nr:uncharacterized protein LOC131075671 [Cryptomeria japonica]